MRVTVDLTGLSWVQDTGIDLLQDVVSNHGRTGAGGDVHLLLPEASPGEAVESPVVFGLDAVSSEVVQIQAVRPPVLAEVAA